jgi:spore germination protein KB
MTAVDSAGGGGEGSAGRGPVEAISNGQAMLIIIGAVLAVIVFVLPGPVIDVAGNDAYLAPMLATLPSIVSAWLFVHLSRRHGWAGPTEYLRTVFGNVAGTAVAAVYLVFFLVVTASVGQEIPKVVGAVIMPMTPQLAFVVPTALAAAYVAYLGLENFGRLAQLVVPLLMLVLVAVPLADVQQADFGYVLPILNNGWRPVLRGMAFPMAIRGEGAVLFAFLLPHFKSPRRGFRAGVWTTCLLGLLLGYNVVFILSVFSPRFAAGLALPSLELARMARLSRAVEHLEAAVLGPWLLALTFKVAFYVCILSRGLAEVIRLTDWKTVVLPVSATVAALGMYLYPSSMALRESLTAVRPGFTLVVAFLIPVTAVVVSLIRRTGTEQFRRSAAKPKGHGS